QHLQITVAERGLLNKDSVAASRANLGCLGRERRLLTRRARPSGRAAAAGYDRGQSSYRIQSTEYKKSTARDALHGGVNSYSLLTSARDSIRRKRARFVLQFRECVAGGPLLGFLLVPAPRGLVALAGDLS